MKEIKFFCHILAITLMSNYAFSQNNNGENEVFTRDGYCTYVDDNNPKQALYIGNANKNSNDVIDQILKYTGIKKNFSVKSSSNIDNAEASIRGEIRYIIFNQKFLSRLKKMANNDWAVASIMAHELGHHLQGHTLGSGGSKPELELEADKYSGFILQKMGASLEDAQAAMQAMGSDVKSLTHPAKGERLTAISNGWNLANELGVPSGHGKKPDKERLALTDFTEDKTLDGRMSKHSYEATEEPEEDTEVEDEISYVARLVFDDEPDVEYYITDSNEIVGFNAFDQPVIVGDLDDSDDPQFVYMFHINHTDHYVNKDGIIYIINNNNKWEDIGYVTDDE